ncbi:MAG: S-adenosylmethionine:tRNA ribosyltransferase-isomerase, partial [Syntrophobacterales bacterium]|nr:S-adenosylmethionine:tRNA ribosyltransferase-isomerase [Syntrophobacterales bacterium]
MKLSDFDYHLPPEHIAQFPSPAREQSRMMVVSRKEPVLHHQHFFNIADWLVRDDTIVINDSQVIPARLCGKKETGAAIEILLLSPSKGASPDSSLWEVLLRPGKRIRPGTLIALDAKGEGKVLERLSEKKWLVEFKTDMPFDAFLSRFGHIPLPPYIDRKNMERAYSEDQTRYQTVYARHPGSVAAPTAGLHFTSAILQQLQEMGVNIVRITLHVGYGTFVPIEAERIEDHRMDEEFFEISPEAARIISASPRVIAVGTTSARV